MRVEREVRVVADGLVRFDQRFSGTGCRVLVTHQACLLAQVEVREGRIDFPLASGRVIAPERFVLWIPARSVLPIRFDGAVAWSEGLGAEVPLAEGGPALLTAPSSSRFTVAALRIGRRRASLDADAGVPPKVVPARALLHQGLATAAPVALAARQVRLSPEALSRAFFKAYQVRPKEYCLRARLFDAALGLLRGVSR